MMLVNEDKFPVAACKLNQWFEDHLKDRSAGVLVAHNVATDIQFLACEYLRHDLNLPSKIKLGLDTMGTLKRFGTICYRKV